MKSDPSQNAEFSATLEEGQQALDRAARLLDPEDDFRRKILSQLEKILDAVTYLHERKVEEVKRELPKPAPLP